MVEIIVLIAVIGTIPFCLYVLTLLYPAAAPAMSKHPSILLTAIIAGAFILSFAFHEIVVAPCRATTGLHTVTDNLGRFYQTEYRDSGDWCLWVRQTF